MTGGRATLRLTREQIVAFRRRVAGLDERAPFGVRALRKAAWAGLQDSMPRAALLSLHARLHDVGPTAWEHPSLVQIWGPRYNAYVVPQSDVAPFTLGRLGEAAEERRRADAMADRLDAFLAGRTLSANDAATALGVHPNAFRYAAPTGRVLMRWDGARRPTVWMVPAPDVDQREAQLELARRHLHVLGPSTPAAFARWAGIGDADGAAAFDALRTALAPVRTPVGDAWILAADEAAVRQPAPETAGTARLLPSGDTFFLCWGRDRELLVPDPARRAQLWTSRVWPGALLVSGELAGTWRRAGRVVQVDAWRPLTRQEREVVEAEASALPLPNAGGPIAVRWEGAVRRGS